MFDSALELITEAASNSLYIFCFCNLIILMILMGSKPRSSFEKDQTRSHIARVATTTTYADVKQGRNFITMHSFPGLMQVKEVSDALEEPADDEEEFRNENSNCNDNEDELRRRVEEFIEKVNKGWKEEKQRTSSFVSLHCLNL